MCYPQQSVVWYYLCLCILRTYGWHRSNNLIPKCLNIPLKLQQCGFHTKNCFSSDRNKGLGKKKTFITYSSPNSPLSRSNAYPTPPPRFCTPPLGMFFFYWHFSSICCINCSSVQEQGSRAQYGASNYLCPLCARATKYLTNPYGAGCRLTWRAG